MYDILHEQDLVSSCVIVARGYRQQDLVLHVVGSHCLARDPLFIVDDVPLRVIEPAQRVGEPRCILFAMICLISAFFHLDNFALIAPLLQHNSATPLRIEPLFAFFWKVDLEGLPEQTRLTVPNPTTRILDRDLK